MDAKTEIAVKTTDIVQKLAMATNEIGKAVKNIGQCDFIHIAGLADEISALAKRIHEMRETNAAV